MHSLYNCNYMYYLFGLQNPGREFEQTPHNMGGVMMDMFWTNNETFFEDRREERHRKRFISKGRLAEQEITAIFSNSFMNTSGTCVSDIAEEDKEHLMVIHDDIDLPFGEVKISFDKGAGGHNGVKDIVKVLDTQKFIRIRIGVAPVDWFGKMRKPRGRNAVNNYLTRKQLSKRYSMQYGSIYSQVEEAVLEILRNGRQAAMNKFN